MPDSFEAQNSRPAPQPVELRDGEQLDFHAANPQLRPYAQVAGHSLAMERQRRRELYPHERIGLVGERLDHFRLWEQELADESGDFALWERELTEANDFARWERELGDDSSPQASIQTGYELTSRS